jgi:hypothetical protein
MAHARSVWINAFESHAHGAHNALVCPGWGHVLPMDDILNSTNGRIAKDIQNVLMAVKYQALPNRISREAIGPRPKSLGHGLEIILWKL